MSTPTLAWNGGPDGRLVLLDQTRLPGEVAFVACEDVEAVRDAIGRLVVRGAPAIGVAAAYGCVLAMRGAGSDPLAAVEAACDRLASARPTAVNLAWAVERMRRVARGCAGPLADRLLAEARAIHEEDAAHCAAIGRHGAALIPDGARVLTHCNAGALATAGSGTALGVIYAAVEAGKRVEVFADETRPLLQGARLTAWELRDHGIPVTVLPDVAAGSLMARRGIDLAIVGADRIAANGDVANKIGTYQVAVLAARHAVPFYVAAPTTTFDLGTPDGQAIPIEERAAEEVTAFNGRRVAPDGVPAYNPAFDVTQAALVTAIVTERGVIRPVTPEGIRRLGA